MFGLAEGEEPRGADALALVRAEQRLAEAQRLSEIGSFDCDLEAGEVTWSPETYRVSGVDPEHLVPSLENVLAMVIPEDRERLRDEVDAAIRDDGGFDCFVTIRRGGGELRDLRVCAAVHAPAGGSRHLIGICQDLTDIRAAQRERIELDERFRSVFERAPVGIALVAPGGRFEVVNEALAEFLGRAREALPGMLVEEVTHRDDLPESTEALKRMAAGELAEWNTENRYVRPARVLVGAADDPGGQRRRDIGTLEFEAEVREYAGEELEGFAAMLGAQVGEFVVRKRAEEQRLHEALHDPLTGLPNRVLFFDRLDHAMARQQREHAPLAVLFLDFDGFKGVNDRIGHAGGDRVLRRAATAVASTLRAEDGGALRRRRARRAVGAHRRPRARVRDRRAHPRAAEDADRARRRLGRAVGQASGSAWRRSRAPAARSC